MMVKPLTATRKLNFLLGNPGIHLSTQKHENVNKISQAYCLTLNSENPTLSSGTKCNQMFFAAEPLQLKCPRDAGHRGHKKSVGQTKVAMGVSGAGLRSSQACDALRLTIAEQIVAEIKASSPPCALVSPTAPH